MNRLTAYHGVQPLVYCHLRTVAEHVPDEFFRLLRGFVGARSAHSIVLEHELGRLIRVFESEGVDYLVVKGPVLARSVYGGVALRPFSDIDLIVRRSEFGRVERVLEREGYASALMQPNQKALYLYVHGQYTFWRHLSREGIPLVLDIHTAVMPPGYSYREDFDALLARSGTVALAGAEARVFEREDLLQVLCYHGFKNRWDRLKYFCDVAELIRSYPDLDWDRVYGRARAMRSTRVLWLGLALSHELLGAPLPSPVERDVRGDRWVRKLRAAILERLPRQAEMLVEPYLDRVQLNILSQDSLRGGVRYGAYSLVRRASEFYLPAKD